MKSSFQGWSDDWCPNRKSNLRKIWEVFENKWWGVEICALLVPARLRSNGCSSEGENFDNEPKNQFDNPTQKQPFELLSTIAWQSWGEHFMKCGCKLRGAFQVLGDRCGWEDFMTGQIWFISIKHCVTHARFTSRCTCIVMRTQMHQRRLCAAVSLCNQGGPTQLALVALFYPLYSSPAKLIQIKSAPTIEVRVPVVTLECTFFKKSHITILGLWRSSVSERQGKRHLL